MGITMTLSPTLEQYKCLMKYKLGIFVYILIKGLECTVLQDIILYMAAICHIFSII